MHLFSQVHVHIIYVHVHVHEHNLHMQGFFNFSKGWKILEVTYIHVHV